MIFSPRVLFVLLVVLVLEVSAFQLLGARDLPTPESCADALKNPTDAACLAYDERLASQGWINDGHGNYERATE